MAPTKIPHLCGGILFDLFLEARKPRRKVRNKLSGGTDGLTAADVYSGLIEVVIGEKMDYAGRAFNKCVSNYKNCSSSKGVYVPFTEQTTQSAFDAQYKRKDPDLLEKMLGFIDTFLITPTCYDSTTRTVSLGNETVKLPVQLISQSAIAPHELPYINALYEVYAEKINMVVTLDTIDTLSPSLRRNYAEQRKAYYSAESVQRSVREVFFDGEQQFQALKDDAFDGISTTYYDE